MSSPEERVAEDRRATAEAREEERRGAAGDERRATAVADRVDRRSDAGTPAADLRREPEVNKLFRMVMKFEGSDLHLKVGLPPMMRLRGDIRRMEMRPLTQEDMERLLLPGLSAKHRKILDEEGGVDFSYVIGADECRFRVSLFKQRGKLSLVARRVNNNIPNFKELGLPESIEKLCNFPEGLVILAGVTGSGKS